VVLKVWSNSEPGRDERHAKEFLMSTVMVEATDTTAAVADLDALVEEHLPLARALARRYAGRGTPTEDLEQVAALALVKAARGFDPERGIEFRAYAIPTVKGDLRKHFRDSGWTVRPPRRLQELQPRVWRAEEEMLTTLHRSPTPSEIAEHIGAELDEVIEVLGMEGCYRPGSLDRPVGDGDSGTVGELIGGLDPELERSEIRNTLAPLIRRLPERDRLVLELRFVDGMSQQDIGERIGVTQMQVSRILARILASLRETLTTEV
jgi:RNA polymerase sigma-B factor